MIPRRIAEHVRTHNWFAVGIDFLIVVVGVFVGLQVSNWNAARSDAREYRAALDRLRAEVAANLDMLDAADADIAAELPAVRRAYDALATCVDDDPTRQAVNDGLKLISGTNGIQIRSIELEQLTSNPRLLAQQPPAMRSRLSDLRHTAELTAKIATYIEKIPLENRTERIAGLRPGPRTEYQTTYLGVAFTVNRRPLELGEPVSVACKNQDLVAALWLWDRMQSLLPLYGQRLRAEYEKTLKVLDEEAQHR